MRCAIVVCLAVAGDAWGAPAGALDLEVDQHGTTYVLHDAAYSVTFPAKPTVQPLLFKFHDEDFPSASAVAEIGDSAYGFLVKPMPKHWTGAKRIVVDEVRDGFLKGANAKLLAETPTTVVGLDGRHVTAVATKDGQNVYIEAELLWDGEHRVVLGILTADVVRKRTDRAQAFVASLSVQHDARGPIDTEPPADGVATKSGVADLEVVRHGAQYVVRDAAAQVVFPARPTFRTYMSTPVTIVAAEANAGEVESLAFAVLVVAAGDEYDPIKGRNGARDGMLKEWTKEHHTESKAKVGGLDGTRIVVTGSLFGVPARAEIRIAWDAKHRRMFTVMAATSAKKLSTATIAFLDSFAVGP